MGKLLKIGELAKEAGVSIRTLHHYDQTNLLKPAAKESGHRLYNGDDVQRLQQIISLKSMGLSLKDIKVCLQENIYDLYKILKLQEEALEQKSNEVMEAKRKLRLILSRLEDNQAPSTNELLNFIKESKKMEEYYTPEQLKYLQERLAKYPRDVKKVEDAWPVLFAKFEKAMKNGVEFSSDEVGKLAQEAQKYIDLFTGGDREIEENLDRAYSHNQENALNMWGVSKEVFAYAHKARMHHIKKRG